VSEQSEQEALFTWAAWRANQVPELAYYFAIPNGGLRDKAVAGQLKAAGVKAGVLDTFLPVPRGVYCGLWIELKTGAGRLSKDQRAWVTFLLHQRYRVHICYAWEEAVTCICDYLGITDDVQAAA
jgi:hypothetical protein